MMRNRLLVTLATASVCFIALPARAVDVDEDSIDDALEQTLIDMYRPTLFYDSAQSIRPCSVEEFVRNSQLIWRLITPGDFEDHVIFTEPQLEADPLLILSGGGGDIPRSNMIEHPHQSTFRINVADSFWHGPPPPIAPVGTYAHVVPLSGPLNYTNGGQIPVPPFSYHDVYLIQYFQFLPANDFHAPGDMGDHEGDWLWVDLLVARTCPYDLIALVYHHHGDDHCPPTVQVFGSLPVQTQPYPLACDPANLVPPIQCFLEVDAHEWWHFASGGGECSFVGFDNRSHNGQGPAVQTQNVMNLGERYAPMPGLEPQLILFFNGLWGHDHGFPNGPSPGPLFQLPPNYPHCPLVVAHVAPSAAPWNDDGLGSRYHPFTALADAIEGPNAVKSGGRVLIAPGNYSGTDTFTRAMRLEREGMGTVVIGQ